MRVSNEKAWTRWVEANTDPYGARVISYARDWAELMEGAIDKGKVLQDVAKETSHDADYDGITGFMYGAAVRVLFECWEHGEDLRRWHNLDTQIGDEGERANEGEGVLNPALLRVGLSEDPGP